MEFTHLHVHTEYSLLDGSNKIKEYVARVKELGMDSAAITDHGVMYGVIDFYRAARAEGINPILGCEVYVAPGSRFDREAGSGEDRYYHLVLLAENNQGYSNLMKIVSKGFTEGFYYKPRVDLAVLKEYHEGIIALSACLAGEVARYLQRGMYEDAKAAALRYQDIFGKGNFFLELQDHGIPAQQVVNQELLRMHEETGIDLVATNDVHYTTADDADPHDILLCLQTNKKLADQDRMRYEGGQYYVKSPEEMAQLFPYALEALENTHKIAERCHVEIEFGVTKLPRYDVPDGYTSWEYLNKLCFEGLEERYHPVTDELKSRLNYELSTIKNMGYVDYFLIVWDFIKYARDHEIMVGPGRGSAAGSLVAYTLGITQLDPIRYDLLFERFLNPERVSMPDIDVDFDDDGRYRVIQYVQDRYGVDHVSHVITFGTMAAKGAIKDVARISRLPLEESNRLTKMIPDKPITITETSEVELKEDEVPEEGDKIIEKDGKRFKVVKKESEKKPTLKNCVKYVPELKNELENGSELVKEVLKYALQLEGCIRQIGIHACAMIIGRGNLTDYIPITLGMDKATNQKVWVSQYEGSFIEDVGMLKMDFLGLKTLTIIKICLAEVKKRFGIDIDIEKIPIDDPKAYEIYSNGDTKSVFQFESPGMMEWLQKLHPERFEDLIAMNALYRPGPMDYIPSFVARKRGDEPITYDLPAMEEFLKETYGVTVYQEQVMLISQKVAGFSKGKADKLRKAMGKKKIDILQSLYGEFIEGGKKNGHPEDVLKKIWKDWEKFASYAFNKSHATCYAWVSYQTGWLKAHYPSEFQAANLSINKSNMTEIQAIMADCKKHHIRVLNPDVNESESNFTVNKNGDIRFGMGGMKGFGANIVDAIVKEREERGLFADVYDFCVRMCGIVNRKAMESLIYAGAFDSFGIDRNQYFITGKSGLPFLDDIMNYASVTVQNAEDDAASLFGDAEELKIEKPEPPALTVEPDILETLQKEKEIVGMYLSDHPLKKFEFELDTFTSCKLSEVDDIIAECNKTKTVRKLNLAGLITSVETKQSKTGRPYAKIIVEDFSGSRDFVFFGKEYENYLEYLKDHTTIFIEGTVKEAWFGKDDPNKPANVPYKFRINKMSLLGNIADSLIDGFSIEVPDHVLSPDFRKKLKSVLKTHKGTIPLSMYVSDHKTEYGVDFIARKYPVNVSADFIADLRDLGLRHKVTLKNA